MKQNNTCQDSKGSQYSPFNPLKFNIPNDPHRKCKGCGESKGQKFEDQNPKTFTPKYGSKQKQLIQKSQLPQKGSSSESSLNFLQDRKSDKGRESRNLGFQGHGGTSFGAHLLRKSKPLLASQLTEKLKFKRDSEAGNIITQNRRKLTQPPFIDEVDSDELLYLRKSQVNPDYGHCPQSSRPFKKNFFNNQYLTTSNRAKEGLKYVMATNFPRVPSNAPSSIDSQPPPHEIKDVCGRKTHHPKLIVRDLGKRLGEAPSMTKELDDLYKEYQHRCPEGNEHTEACRFLHHAPSPHHREPRRSILKDQHLSMSDFNHMNRKSSHTHAHLVRFDKEVDLMSTAMTKVNGTEASLRDTDGRLKLLRHADKRVIGSGTGQGKLGEKVLERYPLHVKCPKKRAQLAKQFDLTKQADQEELEDKTAKQELARIYFTQEATKLMAAANLPALNRDTNVFTKIDMLRKPSFPRFFMDRLMDETEAQIKRKQQDKVTAVKDEMDAFDESVKDRKYTFSKFDPSAQVPNEKSLNDLKLKMEIMKKQRERDVQRATERNRTRKSYFRQMLPCFPDLIRNDLMEYSLKRACKLSGEEMMLASDLLTIARQRDGIEEHQRKYDEDEEEMISEGEEEDKHRESEKIVREILDVCVDVVVKIGNYKEATGRNPPESLKQEWRNVGFSFLNQLDASASGQTDQGTDAFCKGEGSSEEDSGSQQSHRLSELSNESTGGANDASTSGRSDGDENNTRCIVTINTVKEQTSGRASTDGKPVTSVQVQVTDCLHEDLESALTYDGLYLPMSGSQLTNSSSETTLTKSSGTPSKSPTDSPGDSAAECALGIDKVADAAKARVSGFEYEEYEGENEEYFDENGQPVIPVIGVVSGEGISNAIRVDGELTEETEMDEGFLRVGEVEIQALDYSEDSPEGRKSKGLHFSDVVDTRSPDNKDNPLLGKTSARNDSKISLKFALPSGFESKRNPVMRKPTTFYPKDSFDDYMDDDDDDIDYKDVTLEYRGGSEGALSLRGEDDEGEEEVLEDEEEGDEGGAGTGSSKRFTSHSKAMTACIGPSNRKILVYGELGNVTYGMYTAEHEKKFLQHRIKELMGHSETWGKGLNKPPSVLTLKEKICVPFSSQFPRKRLPPFNILDTYIPRPKFSLRMKKLIKMAEQAKAEKEKCAETVQQDITEQTEVSEDVTRPVKQTCSDMIKGKSRIRPKWQDEIAEYECRRKEREKLMEAEMDEDYAKTLGFQALYNTTIRQTFAKASGHTSRLTLEDKSSEHEGMSSDKFRRSKSMACAPGADGSLPEVCIVEEEDDDEGEEELDYDNMVCNHEAEETCTMLNRRYLEISGEGMEEEEFLEYPSVREDANIAVRSYSIQDFYNE